MLNKIKSISTNKNKHKSALFLIFILVIAGSFYVMLRDDNTKPTTGTIKVNASTKKTANKKTEGSSNKPAENSLSSTTKGELSAPYGSLISNHRPGQNGSNLAVISQCITTPGASCRIEFSKDGVTRKLPDQKVDSSGEAFWDWRVNEAGLSKGEWQVSAIATKDGETKTTTDKILLEITQ